MNPAQHNPVKIAVSELSFSYGTENTTPILNGVSLDISPGTMVAFIGPSGAGKSTLASLILGLLSPDSGSVSLENMAPKEFIKSNPGAVSLVQQATNLVSGTVVANIALGVERENVDQDALAFAISAAELTEWVAGLEDGQDTHLDAGSLSGGQLQRIGLARALYTRPRLLVLDEPTSALDADTESRISKSLDSLHGIVTQIIIAHRLTTIEHADAIYLLEGGVVAARGSFAELKATSPTVARQVELLTFKK